MLNIPLSFIEKLEKSTNILIAGIGGGFDVFGGLPIYHTLKEIYPDKNFHFSNYTFTDIKNINNFASTTSIKGEPFVFGATSIVTNHTNYYPEGFLSKWFKEKHSEDKTIWMISKVGPKPLTRSYQRLVDELGIDAIILVDGGIDSLMVGNEEGSGTMVEDTINLAAIKNINVPVKLLVCVGLGTEVEEKICNLHALENISRIIKEDGFHGSCSIVTNMESFKFYKDACEYVWSQPGHKVSHIHSRIIPAVEGEFGDFNKYETNKSVEIQITPLMSQCWFFDADVVINKNIFADDIMEIDSFF